MLLYYSLRPVCREGEGPTAARPSDVHEADEMFLAGVKRARYQHLGSKEEIGTDYGLNSTMEE